MKLVTDKNIVVGSIVELNSGSITMVVVEIKGSAATCSYWLESDFKYHAISLPVACLTLIV